MTPIQTIPLKTISGKDATLADYAGQVLLVVNVASQCGLTPQYASLQKAYEEYHDRGLTVLGFPANDFGAQEPGTDHEIATFCQGNFGVAFPMFSKITVTGEERHPLYDGLVDAKPQATGKDSGFRDRLIRYGITPKSDTDVLWNFEKFLIARDGSVTARFSPDIPADDPMIVEAIEAELAKAA